MRLRRTLSVLLALIGTSSWSGSVRAQAHQLEGHWEGAIPQPVAALEMTVDFETDSSGTFCLPASAAFNWPLRVTYRPSSVRFRLPIGILFEGHLRGDTIRGTVPSPRGASVDTFYLRRQPRPPLPYREEEVTFRSGGVPLAGTLRVPLTSGRHPALFLLQGSGPVARDGEWFYADSFARRGIATLVYDKRGTGASGGDYRDETLTDEAADALAGLHYLQSRGDIDRSRVGLYGRSHGGIVAPLAASLSRDVAFVINVSGAGVPPYRQVTYQAEAEMRRDGFSESEVAEALAYLNLKWQVARTGGRRWNELQSATHAARDKRWLARAQPASKLEDIVPSWNRQMGYDPMPVLEKVKCPVLAIFGEMDTSTPVAQTTANYRKALSRAGNQDVTIRVFPGADHSLLVWPRPVDRTHWPVLAKGFLDEMTTWLGRRVAR